ncbi:hypothetical protein OQA88_1923 [Cercophora sp. LCS_1]
MFTRQWLSSALHQFRSTVSEQCQHQTERRLISTSSPVAAAGLRKHPSTSNPGAKIIGATADREPTEFLSSWVKEGASSRVSQYQKKMERKNQDGIKDVMENALSNDYTRQITRRWKKGDVYAPKDLSPLEMRRWKQPRPPTKDFVDTLGFNPVDNYKNFSLISEFMTSTGRIQHSKDTGLRLVNQRKMAKAIRRAVGMGIHPSVHLHPMILTKRLRFFPHAVLPSTSAPPSQNPNRF